MYSAYKLNKQSENIQPWCTPFLIWYPDCWFLTCIQILQEAGKVVWYFHLFKNFAVYCDLYKTFSVVNEEDVDVFLDSLAFAMIQWMAIWSLVPLHFLNPACTCGSSRFAYCWSLAWRILSITLLACETSAILWYFEHSLALPFFGIEMTTDFFQSCGHCWVFQISWQRVQYFHSIIF